MTNPHDIDELSADGTLMIALMLYPAVITQLSKKNQFEKIGNLSKSYFTKEQKMDWASILKTSLFQDDQDNVAELLEVESESVQKLFSLYVERSHVLYKGNDVIIWLKEIIGYLIKAIDDQNVNRSDLVLKLVTILLLPFPIDRYTQINKEFFTDDVQTVAAENLMPEN